MDTSIQGVSLTGLFTPTKINEKQKAPIKELSLVVFKKTKTALENKEYNKFDANAMDFGCERQASKIYKDLLSKKINDSIQVNNETCIGKKMAFLVQCYLLNYLQESKYDDNGNVKFITNMNRHKDLKIDNLSANTFKLIVQMFQCRISKTTAQFVEKQSKKFNAQIGDNLRLEKMKKEKRGELLYICSSFYSLKLMLLMVKEKNIPILFKKVSSKENSCSPGIVCQLKEEEDFKPIELKEPKIPLIVFSLYVDKQIEETAFAKRLIETGITSILFYNGAIAERIIPNNQEISAYKEKPECKSLFTLFHIYTSTLEQEIKGGLQL